MPFPALFVFFLLVPMLEIWLLIKVGSVVGAGWTVLLVVATAMIGAGLVRAQGLSALRRIQQELAAGGLPADEVLQGVLLLVAGALLLTPGFVTDALGFSLLIPGVRSIIVRRLFAAGTGFVFSTQRAKTGKSTGQDALDAEFKREE
jgi:UPF0716 protein FxsA